MTPKLILCPGQGAQFVGMGKQWFDKSTEARAVFERADKVLGDRLGGPLAKLCFDGPVERLNQTDVSQPAIYVTSVACWHGVLAAWGAGGNGGGGAIESHVAAAAGLSLGEYTALHIAGAFSFEDGLELVTLRGRAMQDAADACKLADGTPGSGMVALIGADEAQAVEVCRKVLGEFDLGTPALRAGRDSENQPPRSESGRTQGAEVLVPANFNAPGQIVISGSIAACLRAATVASEMGLRATALAVAGAFHSPIMQPAADRLAAALAKTPIKAPRCPVASNVTGRTHEAVSGRTMEDSIRQRLVEQLTQPVRWAENCQFLASTYKAEAHELAPGKTLAGLMRRIDKAVKVETHDDPA